MDMNLLAARMSILKGSDIRSILKLVQQDLISLAGGLPAPEAFPVQDLIEISAEVLRTEGASALQYAATEGLPSLRCAVAERNNLLWGTEHSAEEVLITTGSQQALDLVGKLLLDDGDEVLCESPTYIGAISAWNIHRPRWIEVPCDDYGMVPEALERCLAEARRAKMIYVVPNFQNPSGRTWSMERRAALMSVAEPRGLAVIEDNPYGEVRFEGEHLPSLRTLDRSDQVISLGTFSKIFCPGLRLGWITAARPIVEKLSLVKQGADLHSPTFNQMMASRYLERVDFASRIGEIIELYRPRRDAMAAALTELVPSASFTHPQGGLFLWVTLPETIDARALLETSLARGVAFVPGEGFFPNGGRRHHLRLNFSYTSEETIREGIRRIGGALAEHIALAGPSRHTRS